MVPVLEKHKEDVQPFGQHVNNQVVGEMSKAGIEELGDGLKENGHDGNEHHREGEEVERQ